MKNFLKRNWRFTIVMLALVALCGYYAIHEEYPVLWAAAVVFFCIWLGYALWFTSDAQKHDDNE